MESAAIRGAGWVVGKALSPLSGGLVEAWAATTELEPNIRALKMELLNAQAILHGARRREIDNSALAELLQMLRGLGYLAEDVLDELDYFRIQDELEDTSEAVDESSLVRDVRHAATATAKQLCCASYTSNARGSDDETCKCVRRLASRARTTAHAFGKRLLCSSPLYVPDDSKHAPSVPMLKFDRVDVSKRMKCIAEELKPLCAKVSTILGLELSGSVIAELRLLGSSRGIGSAASSSRSITTSQALEPTLYGRDTQKNTIVEDITNGEYIHRDLTIIPIVGPGGIGKTTLTQYIYNSKTVQDHFDIRVWVCVSLDFSVYKMTREILSAIPKAKGEKNDSADNKVQNLDQLQKLIEKRLKNSRFFLVLDDVWKYGNEDEWNRFLVPFKKEQGNGDIVLVTTRFLEVAEMVKRGYKLLQLEGLKPKEYRSLFLACVFDETNRQYTDKNLLQIGEKILEKLKGSPLAAKTVGRLLRHDLTVDHWTRVLESKEWELQTSDHDIMPALKLSYDYLHFDLQQCFSSCALFPEDYKFYGEELVHFWIGLDILRPGHGTKRIEDIGCHNLNELISYGFLKKETNPSGTHYYVMHDLLHNLALKVSSQECLHIASSSPRAVEIAPSVYHLSINISDPADCVDEYVEENFRKGLDKIRSIIKFENLRTLMLFGKYDARLLRIFSDLFKNAKSLRVIFLSNMYYHVDSLLRNFSKLVHLRYLRLVCRKYGCKGHLQGIISRFYQLRVLDIQCWRGPRSLLGDMTRLEKLRHFLSHNEKLHSNIFNVGKLHSLQELQRFEVKKERVGFELRELGKLEELGGSLGIYNLEKAVVNEAHEAKLPYKNRLQKLALNWKKIRSNTNPTAEDQVLESLRPHNNIHELCIVGHGGSTCPTWLGANLSTRGLEALRLDSIDWESLPPLGELYFVRRNGEEYFGCIRGPNFHNLKRLELIGLPRFKRWVADEFCPWYFSVIEVLTVKDCPELTELPFSSYTTCYPPDGDLIMTWFPRLSEIEIENCPKLLSQTPTPFSGTLCSVKLKHVGRGMEQLCYSNKSSISLEMKGNDALPGLDETVLAFDKLTHLQELSFEKCPPLSLEHLQMLTSLKTLKINSSCITFPPLVKSDVKWQLSVTCLEIKWWTASGQELTRLLSHLPNLSRLEIQMCDKITQLDIEAEQKQPATSLSVPASPVVKLQDPQGRGQQQEVAEVVAAEQEGHDGLLLLPAHLSDSLKYFSIYICTEVILTAQTRGAGGGGLQAMRSLEKIVVQNCPKFLSAYKDLDLSFCCPFPTSLRDLYIEPRGMDTLVPLSNLTSLQKLTIYNCRVKARGLLPPLTQRTLVTPSNLTSLQELRVTRWCDNLRYEGLLHLLTEGQLTTLEVQNSPNFFAGWDPARGLQGGQEQPSSKLQEVGTDDIAGVLSLPICRLLSSSLTRLSLEFNYKVERFTKQQEEALSLLTSLQLLQFGWLEKLRCLPAGLHKLTSLKRLEINACPAMRSLPRNGLPGSLQELDVSLCENEELKQRCRRLLGTIPQIRL